VHKYALADFLSILAMSEIFGRVCEDDTTVPAVEVNERGPAPGRQPLDQYMTYLDQRSALNSSRSSEYRS
jgi:hypothetical protein